jgi:DNA-binding winged helix-turn-helix (wHTH) protein/Tol biopolymer transport system component
MAAPDFRSEPTIIRFGVFEVDLIEQRLSKRGVLVRIENHPFRVLMTLLERPGEIVTREELRRRIWRDGTNVGFEDGLNTAVRKLRHALGDSADSPLFIETLPRKGYRFVAPVHVSVPDSAGRPDNLVPNRPINPVEEIKIAEHSGQSETEVPRRSVAHSESQYRFKLLATAVVLVAAVTGITYWLRGRWQKRAPEPSVQARRLEGAHAWQGTALSPDGRYVAYVASEGRISSIRLRQLAKGGDAEIVSPRKTYYKGLTFSPDGDELYFIRDDDDTHVFSSLYRMPTLGGPAQKLIADVDSPVSFAPDGRRFVFVRFHPDSLLLEVRTANADGTGEELLKQFPNYQWCYPAPSATWSPDGRTAAVPFRDTHTSNQSSLLTVDVATRGVEEVYSGAGCIGRPLWTPDQAIMFSREGEIWTLNVRTREVFPTKRRDSRMYYLLDASRDGKTAVAVEYEYNTGLWVVPERPPAPAKELLPGDSPLSLIEPLADGKILMTKVDHSIWTATPNGGDWRRLGDVRGQAAIPCGHGIVVWKADDRSLVRFNEDGTSGRTLSNGPTNIKPTCSPNGDWVFYVSPDRPQRVMRVSMDGGEPVVVAKILGGHAGSLSISPDANFLAYWSWQESRSKDCFVIQRVSDGRLVKILDGPDEGPLSIRWAPDGKALQYSSMRDIANVWEQRLVGGKPQRITHFGSDAVFDFCWSRDGTRLFVVRGPHQEDLVLLKGLR